MSNKRRRLPRWAVLVGGVVALAVVMQVAAAVLDDGDGPLAPPGAAAAEGLAGFDDCDAVREWYVEEARDRVTPYGLPGVVGGGGMLDFSAEDGADMAAEAPQAGSAPTGTNLQEAGVDEPDVVKTDGDISVSIDERTLVVTDISGAEPEVLGELEDFRFGSGEMLLVGDRLVVFAGAARYVGWGWDAVAYAPTPAWITTVDLADPAAPTITDSRRLGGTVLSARLTDGTVRIALATLPDLPFVGPGGRYTERTALARNTQVIEDSTIEDWLPTWTTRGDIEPLIECADLTHPREFAGFGSTTIITLDPQTDAAAFTSVAASGSQVYASPDRLYVATEEWDTHAWTAIHAFATGGAETSYVASGRVKGGVPDRWAFSESDGVLRVASMQGKGWRVDQSVITTLAEDGDELRALGSVGGLGEKNERIQAVRYFGDLAVLVTFRQVDPLYTVDLSDPANPRKLGELKIPGFSAYLHPTGTDRVLGVGRRADRVQASLFDLSDLTRPTRVDVTDLTTSGWAWTPVEEDSRAFTWLPEQQLALVPVDGSGRSRLSVIRVERDGLTVVREITSDRRYAALRAVPIDQGRIAVYGSGRIERIVDLRAS